MAQFKLKLKRVIRNVADTEDIKEVSLKDEKDICASDFYDVPVTPDGNTTLGASAETIASLAGLTSLQVASLHPKDYIELAGEVNSFLQ